MTVLIIIYALFVFLGSVMSKLCSNVTRGESRSAYALYFTVHSLVACIFFIVSSGGNPELNLPTIIYSLLLAATILINMLISMLMLRYASILGSGLLTSPFKIFLTSLVGVIMFNEALTSTVLIRVAILTLSAALVYTDVRIQAKGATDGQKRGGTDMRKFIPLAVISIIVSTVQSVIPKHFAMSKEVTNEHSFFLMTNVIMLLFGLVLFSTELFKSPDAFKTSLVILKPKKILPTTLNVVVSNVSSLVMMPILAQVDLTVFTPMSAAYGVVVAVAASLCFREKLGVFSYLGAAVAMLAMIIQ